MWALSAHIAALGLAEALMAAPLAILGILALLLATLPTRRAVYPVLLAAAYTTNYPVVNLGPAHLSVLRILVIVGTIRVLARGERLAHGVSAVDRLMFAWAMLYVGLSIFHTSDAWTFRLGMVLGDLGVYVLCRVFIRDLGDVRRVFKVLAVALMPLGILMLLEKWTAHNLFGIMGGSGLVNIRDGKIRAYGPFGHSILAGTVGATAIPMALSLWHQHRAAALLGIVTALAITFASASSGPIMMTAFSCGALMLWPARAQLRAVRWLAIAAILTLQIVMNDPVYFLMARIDLAGGSTGWHRAQLIRASLEHFTEWAAVGTDYTRHWMPTGIPANTIHTDLTNHFLQVGVWGGVPLLMVFVLMLAAAFAQVGSGLRTRPSDLAGDGFLVWTLGAMLFGQVMNFWADSPFDQSIVFFYLALAGIGAIGRATPAGTATSVAPAHPHAWGRSPERSRGAAGWHPLEPRSTYTGRRKSGFQE